MLKFISMMVYSLTIVISFIMLAVDEYVYDVRLMKLIFYMSIIVISLFLYTNYNDKRFKGIYVRITYLFMFGFLIVFFQRNIDLIYGYININNVSIFADILVVKKCFIISLIGLSSFCMGNILFMSKNNVSSQNRTYSISKKYLKLQQFLLVLFILIYFYYTASDVLSGNYVYSEETMLANAGSLANYSNVMIYVLTFTILISNGYIFRDTNENMTLKLFFSKNGILCNALLLIYLSLNFMVGDRGPLITISLVYLLVYLSVTRKKIRLIYIVIAVAFVGVLLTTMGEIRRESNKITINDVVMHSNREKVETISPITVELANSYRTFTYTVADIPSKRGYFGGMMQLRELIMSVPFLHRFVPFVYSQKSYENSSTDYCSYLIQGLNRTYGDGTSLLANLYMDFGVLGVICIMFFLGGFMYRLDIEIYDAKNIYWYAVATVVFSFSLYMSRSALTTPLYYILPSVLILYVSKYFRVK